jgi:hypothetical protein
MKLVEAHIAICATARSKFNSDLRPVLTQMEVMFQEAFVL